MDTSSFDWFNWVPDCFSWQDGCESLISSWTDGQICAAQFDENCEAFGTIILREGLEFIGRRVLDEALNERHYGRAPDYVVVEGAWFSDFFGLGGGAFVTYTRSGQAYFAPEGGIGTPGFSLMIRAVWLIQSAMPANGAVDAFVSGWSATASAQGSPGQAAVGVTCGFTGADLDDLALEGGVTGYGEAGASVTGSFCGRSSRPISGGASKRR